MFNSLNMNNISLAISSENPYGWTSLNEAFRDFQIAKFINRVNYWAPTEADSKRYFLFSTILQPEILPSKLQSSEWSAIESPNRSTLLNSKPQNVKFENLVVVDDPGEPIVVKDLKSAESATSNATTSNETISNKRYFRIFYQSY